MVQVRGYDVPIDPALLPDVEAGFEAMRIIQVNVDGSVYIEGGMSDTYGGRTVGMERVVAIERVSADGHTGTAVLGTHGGDIVFSWTCAGGP